MDIRVLADYPEDNRISMDLYAQHLAHAINRFTDYNASIYTPSLPAWLTALPLSEANQMRIARYYCYPRTARTLNPKASIYHIADHGYAHLIDRLPSSKTFVTVHDIIPILISKGIIEGITSANRPRLAEYSASKLKAFNRVITISNSTRRDLIDHCGIDPERIEVVYYGIDPQFNATPNPHDATILRSNHLDNVPFVISSGSAVYKNVPTTLHVLRNLLDAGHDLRLAHIGPEYEKFLPLVQKLGLNDHVIMLGKVAFDITPTFYRNAQFLLFPSLYEGFGWPPLEAMACGTPALISNVASLPECGGGVALQADPLDIDQHTQHALKLLNDPTYYADISKKGVAHANTFSWQRYGERIGQLYDSCTSR